jgi:hypothetical protein
LKLSAAPPQPAARMQSAALVRMPHNENNGAQGGVGWGAGGAPGMRMVMLVPAFNFPGGAAQGMMMQPMAMPENMCMPAQHQFQAQMMVGALRCF